MPSLAGPAALLAKLDWHAGLAQLWPSTSVLWDLGVFSQFHSGVSEEFGEVGVFTGGWVVPIPEETSFSGGMLAMDMSLELGLVVLELLTTQTAELVRLILSFNSQVPIDAFQA